MSLAVRTFKRRPTPAIEAEGMALDYFAEEHLADLGLDPALRRRLLGGEDVVSAQDLLDRLALLAGEVRP